MGSAQMAERNRALFFPLASSVRTSTFFWVIPSTTTRAADTRHSTARMPARNFLVTVQSWMFTMVITAPVSLIFLQLKTQRSPGRVVLLQLAGQFGGLSQHFIVLVAEDRKSGDLCRP